MTENKTYEVQGQTFVLNPTELQVKKYGIELMSMLQRLQYKHVKGVDFSLLDGYDERISILEEAKKQVEEILKEGKDEESNELSPAEREVREGHLKTLMANLDSIKADFDGNYEAQRLKKLREQLNSNAMAELLVDTDSIKPVLKQILKGDLTKIELTQEFAGSVIADFFSLITESKKK